MASLRRRKNRLPAPPRWRHPAIGSASPALRAAADLAMQTARPTAGPTPPARRGHIREVTAEDIRAGLGHLSGWPLCNATMAVRSLFGFAKKQGLIFANPARGLAASRPAASLLPIDDGEIRAVEQAVSGPAQRLMITLAAVHAARWDAIRVLTLDDIDLPGRRITTAGHSQRPGDLSHQALRAWLDHRRATCRTPRTSTS